MTATISDPESVADKPKIVRAAVIGMGPHGRRIAGVIQELPNWVLAAVVDQRAEALANLDVTVGTIRLSSVEMLWNVPDIDVVCIATNAPSHLPLTCAAIQAGIGRVMVEKPMACSVLECEQLLSVARSAAARIAVNQVLRHSPLNQWLRDRIVARAWGQLRCLWIQRSGIGLGCIGVHSFDLVRFLTASEIRRVTAWVDMPLTKNPRGEHFIDPGGLVVLELDTGWRAAISQIEDGAGPTSLELDCTAGRVRVDEQSNLAEIIERDLSIKPGPGRPPVHRIAQLPEMISVKNDMRRMLAGTLTELAGTGPMLTDGRHGLAAIEILAAAHLSHRRGNVPVDLPLESAEEKELWLPIT